MQLKGWGPTRASRIVIILLVVQYLGLGQVQDVASATAAGRSIAGPAHALTMLDTVASLAVSLDPICGWSAVLGEPDSSAILPDPAPLLRRLPRAPPAA